MNSRRSFLKSSAATTAAITLQPLLRHADAEPAPAVAAPKPNARLRATPVPLDRVRLTGGPLKHAQDITATYLLSLDPDRMLAFYRERAGLPKKAEGYTGWDGGGRNLTGHIAGHHLSGVSYMYQATGDARFKQRADYIVRELDEVQRKNGDGYAGALEGLREAFAKVSKGEIKSGGFDLNGLWSPWYTLHKTFAGLRDAYRYTGNALALKVETGFATWAEGVLAPLTDAQVQQMLLTEHGGMNEVLSDLSADTGDERWMKLSRRFEHHAFTLPLKRHQDNLSGKHGNCQIPKLIGSTSRYINTGDTDDLTAATFFYDRVVRHHSYASGGHGLNEYFGPPDVLSTRVDGRAAETCNVYNMIKLSRLLFAIRPDAAYADFHERALFNHILASIDPTDARTSYMVPVGHNEQQEYQDLQRDFTCCVGTGMESHALHGLGVYFESADAVYVNLFVPSTAQTQVHKAQLTMESSFPDGDSATITIALPSPATFTVNVRRPTWAGDGFRIAVNGENVAQPALASLSDAVAGGRAGGIGNEADLASSTYVSLTRAWKSGDVISVTLPKALRLEPTPDNPKVTAIMWGPLALAADMGPRGGRTPENATVTPRIEVPALVSASRAPSEFVTPGSTPGDFTIASGVTRKVSDKSSAPSMSLAPFYRTHRKRYSLYYDLYSPAEFDAHIASLNAAKEAATAMAARTVGGVTVGDAASEKDRNYQSDTKDRAVARTERRTSRGGTGWFSYDLPADASAPMYVVLTHFTEPGLPAPTGSFEIIVDGTVIGHYSPSATASGFFDQAYEIPQTLTTGKDHITVKVQSIGNGRIVPIFSMKTVRK